jgi:hypothetical protein
LLNNLDRSEDAEISDEAKIRWHDLIKIFHRKQQSLSPGPTFFPALIWLWLIYTSYILPNA